MPQEHEDKGKKGTGKRPFAERNITSRMTDQGANIGSATESENVVEPTEKIAEENRSPARSDTRPIAASEEPIDLSPTSRTPSPLKSPLKRLPSTSKAEAKRFREGIEAAAAKTPEKQTSPVPKEDAGTMREIHVSTQRPMDLGAEDLRQDSKLRTPTKSPSPLRSPNRSPLRSPYKSPYKRQPSASKAEAMPFKEVIDDRSEATKREFYTSGRTPDAISEDSREEKSTADSDEGAKAAVKKDQVGDKPVEAIPLELHHDSKNHMLVTRSPERQLQLVPSDIKDETGEKRFGQRSGEENRRGRVPGDPSGNAAARVVTSTVSREEKVGSVSKDKTARSGTMGAVGRNVCKGVNEPKYEKIRTGRIIKKNPGSATSSSDSEIFYKTPVPVVDENDRPIMNLYDEYKNLVVTVLNQSNAEDDARLAAAAAAAEALEAAAAEGSDEAERCEAAEGEKTSKSEHVRKILMESGIWEIEEFAKRVFLTDTEKKSVKCEADSSSDEAVAGPSASRDEVAAQKAEDVAVEDRLQDKDAATAMQSVEYKTQIMQISEKDKIGEKIVKGREDEPEVSYQETQPGGSGAKEHAVTPHEASDVGKIGDVAVPSGDADAEQVPEDESQEFPPILQLIKSFDNPQILNLADVKIENSESEADDDV